MPLASLIIGIDSVPIKPIPGTICLQGDLTWEKTRADLKSMLRNVKADVVLHDGAPIAGKDWMNDAYQESLQSFQFAAEHLCKVNILAIHT